ncbi:hypothetical protein A4X13_0g6234 [Tilletia indica]|uniref:Uncharacterized protein n=1 Tax=Tilletia indica TaxID=43049 RepID=A0A8T8SP60_9BASI|nr:hypothetical protein A4X13_0g6234 [Tilletia indica]
MQQSSSPSPTGSKAWSSTPDYPCLPQRLQPALVRSRRSLEQPVYLRRVKGRSIFCLDRSAHPQTIAIDPTEYRFKLALFQQKYDEVLDIVKTSNLVGQAIVAYLRRRATRRLRRTSSRTIALVSTYAIEAITIIVELAYTRTKNFSKLSFLDLVTGNRDKLSKVALTAQKRNDSMSRFHIQRPRIGRSHTSPEIRPPSGLLLPVLSPQDRDLMIDKL